MPLEIALFYFFFNKSSCLKAVLLTEFVVVQRVNLLQKFREGRSKDSPVYSLIDMTKTE